MILAHRRRQGAVFWVFSLNLQTALATAGLGWVGLWRGKDGTGRREAYGASVVAKCREMTSYDMRSRSTISIRFKNGTFYDGTAAVNNLVPARTTYPVMYSNVSQKT